MCRVSRLLLLLCLAWPGLTLAETSQVFGHYEVHYSVFPTSFLQPEVAKAYGVVRADNRALVTVAVTDRDQPLAGGLPASIQGQRTDLIQRHAMDFKVIREQDATYFINEFRFADRDRWIFDIDVTPEGSNKTLFIRFEKRFEAGH